MRVIILLVTVAMAMHANGRNVDLLERELILKENENLQQDTVEIDIKKRNPIPSPVPIPTRRPSGGMSETTRQLQSLFHYLIKLKLDFN